VGLFIDGMGEKKRIMGFINEQVSEREPKYLEVKGPFFCLSHTGEGERKNSGDYATSE